MKRSDVIREIVKLDGLIIANIGHPSRELYALQDSARNFYMLGSMGLASSVGLGVACSQKRRVCVIDGDGALLMNLGSLATIAHHAPPNYCLIVVDNKAYGSTGNQHTYTAGKTGLEKIAKGAGNKNVQKVKTISGVRHALKKYEGGCVIIVVETDTEAREVPIIPHSPLFIKERFMREVIKQIGR
jgi:sulfopyruvate decarboxylase subunit beta